MKNRNNEELIRLTSCIELAMNAGVAIKKNIVFAGVFVSLMLLWAQPGVAQTTYEWTQTAGGEQSWTNAANWSGGVVPSPAAEDSIIFLLTVNQVAATTVDLGADRTANFWKYTRFGGFNSSLFTIAAGYTINLAGTTPTIETGSQFVFNNVLAGTSGLTKTGSGTLSLNNAGNTFSGGITLAGGTLTVPSDGALGDAGNDITVTANAALDFPNGTYARSLSLSSGAVLTLSRNSAVTLSGAVTGDGGVTVTSPSTFDPSQKTLSSTANTFTGPVSIGSNQGRVSLTVNSFADSASPLTLTQQSSNTRHSEFVWGSGAISALTLDQRQIVLAGNHGHVIENANADANNTITVNTDLSATTTSNTRILYLRGVNTGNNTIAGAITNGASNSLTSLTKEGSGTWVLSGVNTYTGTTLVSGGILKLTASECLADAGTLTINGGKLELEAGVRERIDNLVLGSTTQTELTTYGSTESSAAIKDDARFAGTGVLYLRIDPPPAGTMIIIK